MMGGKHRADDVDNDKADDVSADQVEWPTTDPDE